MNEHIITITTNHERGGVTIEWGDNRDNLPPSRALFLAQLLIEKSLNIMEHVGKK